MFPTDTLQNCQHQIASHDSFRCREVFVFQFESSPSLGAPLDYPLLLLPHRVSSASVHLFTSFAVQSHPAATTGKEEAAYAASSSGLNSTISASPGPAFSARSSFRIESTRIS